jgi:hypothetical protein
MSQGIKQKAKGKNQKSKDKKNNAKGKRLKPFFSILPFDFCL